MMQQSHDTLKKDLEDNQEDLELITKALEIKTEAHELLVENGKLQDTETAITIKKSIADALRKRDFEHQPINCSYILKHVFSKSLHRINMTPIQS